MGGGPGGGAMAIGGGGGAIAAGGGAVCWAQAASARTAPSTYRCFIVNPPGLMECPCGCGHRFFLRSLAKIERPLCRVDCSVRTVDQKKTLIFPGPILSPQAGERGLGANREPARSPVPSYFRCFRRNSYAGWCDTSVLRLALSK